MKIIIIIFTTIFILSGCSGSPPQNLGLRDTSLAPCPGSPNCVSSQTDPEDTEHAIEPLCFLDNPEKTRKKLHDVVQGMGGTTLITDNGSYLYYTFTIPVFGFVDDVEFYIDEANKIIHVRSASRVGYGDLGVNRKRVEKIREKLCS